MQRCVVNVACGPARSRPMRPPTTPCALPLAQAALQTREEHPRTARGCGGALVPWPTSPISLPLATHLTATFLTTSGKGCGERLFRYKKKNGVKSSL